MHDTTTADAGRPRKSRRGRPRARLLAFPLAWRAVGRSKLHRAIELFNSMPDDCREPPTAPERWWEEGLILGSRVKLIHPRTVTSILERGARFERWLEEEKRPGASADRELAMRLFIAEAFARKVIKRRKGRPRKPTTGELAEALEFLFGEKVAPETLRKRFQRFSDRLARFEAAERERRKRERAAKRAGGPHHAPGE